MDASFWRGRWSANEVPFHEKSANPHLVRHFEQLALPQGSRVFVPLCGQSLDVPWLLSKGCRVVGVELSEIAVGRLFHELKATPKTSTSNQIERRAADDVEVFVGDLFDLSREALGPVDAIYDRAALVALPPDLRRRYGEHVVHVADGAPQLLVCYEYDQSALDGPPFSVDGEEVHRLYRNVYEPTLLSRTKISGGLKGRCAAEEVVWLLRPR